MPKSYDASTIQIPFRRWLETLVHARQRCLSDARGKGGSNLENLEFFVFIKMNPD